MRAACVFERGLGTSAILVPKSATIARKLRRKREILGRRRCQLARSNRQIRRLNTLIRSLLALAPVTPEVAGSFRRGVRCRTPGGAVEIAGRR